MNRRTVLFLAIVIVITIVFSGCAEGTNELTVKNGNTKAATAQAIIEAAVPTPVNRTVKAHGEWTSYSTLRELIGDCDFVIIGKVEKVLPTIRENQNPELKGKDGSWANITPSKVLIEKTITGNKEDGEYIYIRQRGGTFTGLTENNKKETITESYEDVVLLEDGTEYLMFVGGKNNVEMGVEYPYFLLTPTVSYPKIVDGKLVTNKDNRLLANGITIEEAIKQIEESQKPVAAKK
jgi:hypothetical protein